MRSLVQSAAQREVPTPRTCFTTGVRWLPSSRTSTSLLLACHCSSCSRRIWCTGRCASCKTTLRNPRACPDQIWRTALELGAHLDGGARYRAGLHRWARRLQSEPLLIDNVCAVRSLQPLTRTLAITRCTRRFATWRFRRSLSATRPLSTSNLTGCTSLPSFRVSCLAMVEI